MVSAVIVDFDEAVDKQPDFAKNSPDAWSMDLGKDAVGRGML